MTKPFKNNPRQLKAKRATELRESLEDKGDISGIVHDLDSDMVICGNQRSNVLALFGRTFAELKASGTLVLAIENEKPDKQGTVAMGIIQTPAGPMSYRAVQGWSEAQKKAANLRGNVGAGEWDWEVFANAWTTEEMVDGWVTDERATEWGRDAACFGDMQSAEEVENEIDDNYSRKIEAPIYTPKGEKPQITELYDDKRAEELIAEINSADIPGDIKEFLIIAARRHTVLNFKKIAEFYSHADEKIQTLMENSALVIIDFDRAIELGYVKLSEEIAMQYSKDYPDA